MSFTDFSVVGQQIFTAANGDMLFATITGEFAGGLRGQRTPVRIQHGNVTFVALTEEQVGGVQVFADPLLCNAPGTLAISRIRSSSGTGTSTIQTVLTLPTRQECVYTIAGLRPGEYQVSLRGKKGQLAAQTFQVAAQALTPLSIRAESVHVTGRVSLNAFPCRTSAGRPLAGVEVDAVATELAGHRPPQYQRPAKTDGSGRFEFDDLPPGSYVFGVNLTKPRYGDVAGSQVFLPGTAAARDAAVFELKAGDRLDVGVLRLDKR